jgi:hypothetical protein
MDLINDTVTTIKSPTKWIKPLIITALIALSVYLLYRLYLHFAYGVNTQTIDADIAAQTSDPNLQSIIKEGVNSILNDPALSRQAYTYSQASGVDYNTVVVTEAINSAKQHGYIQ